MELKWAIARARAMSGREIGFRIGRAVRERVERLGFARASPPAPSGAAGQPWLASLPRNFDSARYVEAAERVLSGTFDVFALREAKLGFPPKWNVDPKTRTAAPLEFGKTLDYRNSRNVGDIKYLWEINRHLELVTLAQAFHLTGESRFALGCRTLVGSWIEHNPYPLGVNWCSSLEHAMRLVNWSFAWSLLGGDGGSLFEGEEGQAFRRRWLDSIYQHCHFIAGHISRHSSANNHLLGERTGLFIAATTWPLWDASRRWQTQSHAELEREALRQNFADGVNKEQAVWYHHAVADMLLLAGLVGRANGRDFSAAYWQRFEAMLEFLASIMDHAGNVPQIGDADDGVMVRFDPARELDVYASLLASGAVLFARGDFKRKARILDDKTRWLLGDESEAKFATLDGSGAVLPVRREFASGGYYVLGDRFETDREVRIVADAGPLGYLSIAAHGHADALAFTLSAGGTEMLIDPGTFAYHTEKRWRDYFRGTCAHNTVRIDGADQSVPGGNFLWLRHARAQVEHFEIGGGQNRLVARHDGYARLADPVQHRRAWAYDIASQTLAVLDELKCEKEHRAEWCWHFAPGCGVRVAGNRLTAERNNVQLTMLFPSELTCRIAAGAEHPPLGWYSRGLDSKLPTVSAVMEGTVRRSSSFAFELRVEFIS
jgi:hypothetical protein